MHTGEMEEGEEDERTTETLVKHEAGQKINREIRTTSVSSKAAMRGGREEKTFKAVMGADRFCDMIV